MTWVNLASLIRGELGYAQLGNLIHSSIGHQILGPFGQEDVCPNGYKIYVQQFEQLWSTVKSAKAQVLP